VLAELCIRDIALLAHTRIAFAPGLNVLSGETGAGKSLVVGSLRLLCGEKAGPELVREGAERGRVEGVFELDPAGWIAREIDAAGIALEDGELVLSREIQRSGKGRLRANGAPIVRSTLEHISNVLFDLHGQHDHQLILRPGEQLIALDEAASLHGERESFTRLFHEWRCIVEEIQERQKHSKETGQLRELRRFQLRELEELRPSHGELTRLAVERKKLEAAELLRRTAGDIADRLLESDRSVHDAVFDLHARAKSAQAHDESWDGLVSSLESLRILAQDAGREAASRARSVEDNPDRLEEIRERIRVLTDLVHKYGPGEDELFALWDELRKEAHDPESLERAEEALKQRERDMSATLAADGSELSKKRKARAKRLALAVAKSLADLGLERARFEIEVSGRDTGTELGLGAPRAAAAGLDAVEFLFSANAGESVRPLRHIASGGEISRVMLALQSHLGKQRGTPTIVFDEIDQGVGGGVAGRIGLAMANLGKERQVICITHLPQVASRADAHFRVSKREEGGRTVAFVERVQEEDRVREIARMLGGESAEGIAVDHARELLRGART
jgi:DNA repair protein RecN (Recombination protein N)